MNKDQLQGRITQVKGDLKKIAGRATGNRRLQGDGIIDHARGKAQAGYGDVQERVRKGLPR
jgi:uncharacterized protein YjbJ (UPF0337 family)